jgi:hypothetical protein
LPSNILDSGFNLQNEGWKGEERKGRREKEKMREEKKRKKEKDGERDREGEKEGREGG